MITSTVSEWVVSRWGSWERAKRAVGYGAVGVTGIPVDLGVLWLLLGAGVHHLPAVCGGYLAAVVWNFALQRQLVYGGDGSVWREFVRYLFVDGVAFGIRVAVVVATVDLTHPWQALPWVPTAVDPSLPASVVGIGLAFLVGSQGTETLVFGGEP